MSTNKTFSTETAERYSRALFEISKESNELDKIESDVKNFQTVFLSSEEFKNFIQDPTQSIKNQNNVINLLSDKLDFQEFKNFLFAIDKKNIFLKKF